MEKVLADSNVNTNVISVFGDNNQVFQIVLKPNDSVFVNTKYLTYASSPSLEEVPYHEVNSLLPLDALKNKNDNVKKIQNNEIIRLKNISNTFEYVGLSKGGKIMKITPMLYSSLFIRLDSLLSFSVGIDLVEDSVYQKVIETAFGRAFDMKLGKPQQINQFVMIKPRIQKANKITVVVKGTNNESSMSSDLGSILCDYVYLASEKVLIEKRLGEGEQIIIMKNGLVAFEKSVSFFKIPQAQAQNKRVTYVNTAEDIIVEGPGLIIFEPFPRIVKDVYRSIGLVVIPLFFLLFQVLIPILFNIF